MPNILLCPVCECIRQRFVLVRTIGRFCWLITSLRLLGHSLSGLLRFQRAINGWLGSINRGTKNGKKTKAVHIYIKFMRQQQDEWNDAKKSVITSEYLTVTEMSSTSSVVVMMPSTLWYTAVKLRTLELDLEDKNSWCWYIDKWMHKIIKSNNNNISSLYYLTPQPPC